MKIWEMKNLGLEGFNLVWNGHLIWKIQQIYFISGLDKFKSYRSEFKKATQFQIHRSYNKFNWTTAHIQT